MSGVPKLEMLESRQFLSTTTTVGLDALTNPAHYVSVGYPTTLTSIVNVINGKVVFSAVDADQNGHIYAYDPTTDMVTLLRNAGTGVGSTLEGAVFNGYLYFGAYEDGGNKLFKTDGTPDGTVVVPSDEYLGHAVVFKGRFFFENNGHLSAFDPATNAVETIAHVRPGQFVIAGDKLFFSGYGGSYPSNFKDLTNPSHYTGYELWVCDGTSAHIVKDINPDVPIAAEGSSYPSDLTELDGRVFFIAYDNHVKSLFVSDGTSAGTHAISIANSLCKFGDSIYYISNGALWKTNGMASSSVTGNEGFDGKFVATSSKLFIPAYNDTGLVLWSSDGTSGGTVPLKSFDSFNFTLRPNLDSMGVINGDIIYFLADDRVHGLELWQSDGTVDGTSLVADTQVGGSGSYANNLLLSGEQMFFTAITMDYVNAPARGLWWVSVPDSAPEVPPTSPPSPPPPPPVVTNPSAGNLPFLVNHNLRVNGTKGNDRITLRHKVGDASVLQVVVNGRINNFAFSVVNKIVVDGSNGHDFINLQDIEIGSTIFGGNGNDSIYGSQAADSINGENGDDVISGMAGNDSITGGIGTDVIRGGEGIDRLFARVGVDDITKNKGDTLIHDILG